MKELTLKFILFFGCCLSVLNTMAYDFEQDGIGYEITSFTHLTVTASCIVDKEMKEVVIPQIVTFNNKDLKVTKIAPSFAANNDSIESVIFEAELSSIGKSAFLRCSNLKDVTINQADSIGERAFLYNRNLKNITLPSTLTYLGGEAFSNCEILEAIELPDSLTTLDYQVFNECKYLNHIDLKNIVKVEEGAFKDCSALSEMKFGELEYIGSMAFSGTALEEFTIPNSVTTLGTNVFENCKNLRKVSIGNGISHLPQCFLGCNNLRHFRIEDGITPITFARGSVIREVYYEDNSFNYAICNGYFSDTHISEVYIGRNFNYLKKNDPFYEGSYSFYNGWVSSPFIGAINLERISMGPLVTQLVDVEYKKDGKLAKIGAFSDCKKLQIIEMSPNIQELDDYCFQNCSSLASINLPGKIQTIGDYCFAGCSALSSITLPNSVSTFSADIFEGCNSLSYVTIGSHTTKISGDSFKYMNQLKKISFHGMTPPQYSGTFTNNQYINTLLSVPTGSLTSYKNISPWSNFWNIEEDSDLISVFTAEGIEYEIKDGNDVEITKAVFDELTELTIPNTISYGGKEFSIVGISSSAFKGNTNLQSLIILDKPFEISDYAFKDCSNLQKIHLPSGLRSIGTETFMNCKSLREISIPVACMSIGNNAFKGSSLSSVIIEEAETPIILGYSGDLVLSSEITPFPNPSNVDERRTGFRNCYYDGLFYGLPIERLIINRDVELSKYYERVNGNSTSNYSRVYNDIIYYSPFYGLSKLKYVEIGEKVSNICKNQIEAVVNAKPSILNYNTFGGCRNIEVVISNNPNAPVGGGFSQSVYETAHLFLPNGGENSYTTDDYWKNFSQIEAAAFVPIEAISFEEDNIIMDTNESIVLHPIIYPEDASIKQLKWSSSDRYYAEVSEDGVVTSENRDATITITAAACDASGISSSIEVTIHEGASIRDVSNDSNIRIFTKEGRIYISGKSDCDIVKIYNPQGQLVQTSKNSVIDLDTDGCFIVRIGSVSKKIIL
ncbi:MAG: leucine-rich repeat protein [Muribaculaceae bacterium]|nr:leucine-rich repeat protein [Muribaculaceae bacterium]